MAENKLSIFAELLTGNFSKNAKMMQTQLGQISVAATKVGKSMSMYVTAPLVAAGAGAVKAAADFQSMETQLSILYGSAEEGKRVMDSLKAYSAFTPFSVKDLVRVQASLKNFNLSAGDSEKMLKAVGDAAAAMNVPIGELQSPLLKIAGTNRVTMESFKQLSERGFDVQGFADAAGIPLEKLNETITNGGISGKMFTEILQRMNSEGGVYFNAAKKQSETLNGVLSTLKDSIARAGATIGDVMLPFLTKLATKLNEALARFEAMDEGVKRTIVVVGGLVAAIGPVLLIFGQVAGAVNQIRMAMQAMGLATGATGAGMLAALGPVLPIILAVGAAALLIYKNWDKITKYFTSGPGKQVWEDLKATFATFKESASNMFTALSDTIGVVFSAIMDIVMTVWGWIGEYVIGTITDAFNFVMGALDHILSYFGNIFNAIASLLKGDFGAAAAYFVNAMIDAAKLWVSTLGYMATSAARIIDTILDWFGVDSGLQEKAQDLFDGVADYLDGWKMKTPEVEADEDQAYEEGEKLGEATKKGAQSKPVVVTATVETDDDQLFGGDLALFNAGTDVEALKKVKEEYLGLAAVMRETGDYEGWQEMLGFAEEAENRINSLKTTTQIAAEEMAAAFKDLVADSMTNAVVGIADLVGQMAVGVKSIGDLGAFALEAIGTFLSQMGAMMVKAGILASKFYATITTNPPAAIAAGAALVALGGMLKGLSSASGPQGNGQTGVGANTQYGMIPAFAEGGAVLGPTLALVGEKPGSKGEAIIPFEKMGQFANMMGINQGGPSTVVVTGQIKGRDIELSNKRGGAQRTRRH